MNRQSLLLALALPIAALAGCSTASSSTSAPAHRSASPSAQTVTFEAKGSPATVLYGRYGAEAIGRVPMDVTRPMTVETLYEITARLRGKGRVTVEILFGGRVVGKGTAVGGHAVATARFTLR